MTIQEWFDKNNGKYIEVSGSSDAKFQCVDAANSYIRDVLNLPIIEWTNAVDFPSKARDKYEYILNTPTGIPQLGDLVIWGGKYGHIAVFKEGDANKFTSFDQNFPVGSPCHFQPHNYTTPRVLGWLRVKNIPQDCDPNWRIERDNNWNLYQGQIEENKKLTQRITELESEVNNYRDLYQKEEKHTLELDTKIADLAHLLEALKNQDKDYGLEIINAQKERDELKSDLKLVADVLSVNPDIKDILRALDELKQPSDEVAKEYMKLAKALENFFYTRVPKAKPFIVKLFVKLFAKVR